jgi:hypothetical protein
VLNEQVHHADLKVGEFREELQEVAGDDVAAAGEGGELQDLGYPLSGEDRVGGGGSGGRGGGVGCGRSSVCVRSEPKGDVRSQMIDK